MIFVRSQSSIRPSPPCHEAALFVSSRFFDFEMGYRSCLGFLSLAKQYSRTRLEDIVRLNLDKETQR
jgi:hypothetical protein